MINEIQIENFKSIKKMKLDLGRVNVFIGENGSGKSNILEAIALAGAAAADKLDNEFLASRGVRAAAPGHMRCALGSDENVQFSDIIISIGSDGGDRGRYVLTHDNLPYSSWEYRSSFESTNEPQSKIFTERFLQRVKQATTTLDKVDREELVKSMQNFAEFLRSAIEETASTEIPDTQKKLEVEGLLAALMMQAARPGSLDDIDGFLIYSPENSQLRIFQREGQIEPLGIHGEGLLKFLQVLDSTPEYAEAFASIRERLKVFGWFNGLRVPAASASAASRIEILDRHLAKDAGNLDQISANEGFLFLLFYFCLFSTNLTPRFFAIDNVDASLNPKLCAHLVKELVALARKNDKQVILTTHNPATLDGLDLNDDEQRLFVVSRGDEGETKVRRIKQKQGPMTGLKLSTAFIDGHLGGLPNNF